VALSLLLGLSILTIIGLVAQPLLLDAFGPGNQRHSVGSSASETNWRLDASFKPGERLVSFLLQMDNMERRPDANYRLVCAEPWAPQWESRLHGRIGDFVRVSYTSVAPGPLDEEAVGGVIASCQVELAWAAGEVIWPPELLSFPQGPTTWPAGEKTITFGRGGSAIRPFSVRERLLNFWLSPWTGRPYLDD